MRAPAALAILAMSAMPALVGSAQQATTAPVWDKPGHFWFRKAIAGGHVWLGVDAVHGVKEPLFDHQRLAIELGVRGAGEFAPLELPFADPAAEFVVKYDGSNAYIQEGAMAIEFNLDGRFWRCDLQIKWNWNLVPPTDYECRTPRAAVPKAGPAGPAGPAGTLSPDRQWIAFVEQDNAAIRPASGGQTRRLSTDGTASAAYHQESIEWSADSRTVSAYKVHSEVWTSTSLSGSVKAHIQQGRWTVAR